MGHFNVGLTAKNLGTVDLSAHPGSAAYYLLGPPKFTGDG